MTKYQKVLLALDLKPEDDEPVSEKAMAIANACAAEVSIIHVVEPIYSHGIPAGAENKFAEWQSEMEDSAKRKLQEIGKKLVVPSTRQYMAVGPIKKQLLRTAEQIQADLIVVGTHAKHGLKTIFFNDTADEMVHNAKCDVLAVNIPAGD